MSAPDGGDMAKNRIELRRRTYFELSSLIAQIDNAQLRCLFEASESRAGWGRNHTIDLGSSKLLVKRVPVTDTELDNFFSTKNLYRLPTYYNYGVGSAGFGVFRELVAPRQDDQLGVGWPDRDFPVDVSLPGDPLFR